MSSQQLNSTEAFEQAIQSMQADDAHFDISVEALEAAQLLSVLYQALSQLETGKYKTACVRGFTSDLIAVMCGVKPEL